MSETVSLYAVGDVCVIREDPESIYALAQPKLKEADILFGQLETTISDRGSPAVHAGVPLKGSPKTISAYTYAGFSILSFASNHTLDWNVDGLRDTLEIARKNGLKMIGAGKDIEEARAPAILEAKGTKVGFLAYNSILPMGYAAGPGKAGCVPIRISTFYEPLEFQPGTPCHIITIANREDLAAMAADIKKLRPQVDVLAVSIHWGVHFMPSTLAMYQRDVGKLMIDAGADIVIGHHAHILKGIEVYKGKVILYSLCNFGFDLLVEPLMNSARLKQLQKIYHWKLDPSYPTYAFPADSRKTIMVKFLLSDKQIQRVSYLPVMINQLGQPEFLPAGDKRSDEVFKYMEWLCQDQELGTKFSYEGDEAVIQT